MGYKKTHTCSICGDRFIARAIVASVCSHQCHLQRRKNWHKVNGDKIRKKDRERYYNGGKLYYFKYEKTPKGFLMRKYRNMQSRVLGIQKQKYHLYKGRDILDRESFYRWAENSPEFWKLYKKWVKSEYNRKLTPTVDRKDPQKGYQIENMEWVTHSENSRRGSVSRHNAIK